VRAYDHVDGPKIKWPLFPLIILFLAAIFFGKETLAGGTARRVLILHSYNYTFPANAAISDSLRKELGRSSQPLEIEADFLDLARRPDEAYALRTATFLGEKYANGRFDAVVVIGIPGMPFLLKYRDLIAPGVPIVWSDVTRATFEATKVPADVAAVINDYKPERTLELAERLQPGGRRLVVIGGTTSIDRRWHENGRRAVEAYNSSKLEAEYWFDRTYSGLLEDVSKLPRDAIVLLLTFFADSEDKRFIPRDVAVAVAKASSAPVYGFFETYLGTGVVGGYLETYQSIGSTTADLIFEILSGAEVTKLSPRDNTRPAFRVDARAMERWGLEQKRLPSGSTVLFHRPSLWEQHRYLISATAAIVVVQSLVVAGLLFQRRRRRQAEESLMESEDRMTFAAASASIGLWHIDRKTDQLWATEHCRAIFGLPAEAPLTRETFLATVHPNDRSIAAAALGGTLKGDTVADIRIVDSRDEVRWVRIRARSHIDGQRTPGQLSGMFADITDQKATEYDLELQRQEVAHLMRVTALGELSGAIAHEINQPLTAILSNAQAALYLLAPESPNFTEIQGALEDIVHEDSRASEVIQRLRGLLKKGESKFESVDLNKLVDSTTALLRHQLIECRVTVETNLADNLPAVLGDPVQLQQVLLNLIMNSIDAMASTPDGLRRIQICTRATEAGTIEVYLKDNGPGIKAADNKRVFVPFYSTKEHGLGLGLSICSTIIERHGGRIDLRNNVSGGAVAEIALPVPKLSLAAN
jgi:C4-dicarboxylate-specific signal transduction histidine kinase